MLSSAVIWAVIGLVFIAVEMFTLSFVLIFFGSAALTVAGLVALGMLSSLATQLVAFGLFGFAGLVFLRPQLRRAFGKSRGHDIDRYATLVASADIPPRSDARLEYQGSPWDAHNDSDEWIRTGQQAVVVETKGIKIVVRPHHSRSIPH